MTTIVRLGDCKLPPGGYHIKTNTGSKYTYIRTHPVGELEYHYDSDFILPFKHRESTPANFRAKLCFDHQNRWRRAGSSLLPQCGDCFKWSNLNCHTCTYCDTIFIRDFFHPKFCYFFPTCWDCTPFLPWEVCPVHTPRFYLHIAESSPIVEPKGANINVEVKAETMDFFGSTTEFTLD